MDGGVEGGGEAKEDKKNYARINLGKQSWIKYLSRIYMNISFFKLRIRILIPGDFLNRQPTGTVDQGQYIRSNDRVFHIDTFDEKGSF